MTPDPSLRPIQEDRRRIAVDRLPAWARWLPLAFVVFSLVAMLVIPLLVGRRQETLRREISETMVPAQARLSQILVALAAEVSAMRGFEVTGSSRFLKAFREAEAREREASAGLQALAARLGPGIEGRARELVRQRELWFAAVDALLSGRLSRDQHIQGVEQHQALFRNVLAAADALDKEMIQAEGNVHRQIRAAQKMQVRAILALALLALGAAATVGWLTARLGSLARRLRYRADEETALRQIGRSLSAAVTVEEVVQRVVESAVETTRAFGAYVEQAFDREVRIVAVAGAGVPPFGTRVPYPGSLTETVIESGDLAIMTEVGAIGESMAPYLRASCQGCTGLVLPLLTEARVLGALVLLRRHEQGRFLPEEASHIRALGHLASAALRRVTLIEETDMERREKTALLESAAEGLYGLDPEGRVTFVNRVGAELLGYAPEELHGRDMHEAIHHTQRDGSPFPREACAIYGVYQTEHAVRGEDDLLWRKDGTTFEAAYSAAPIMESGEVKGVVVAFSDITERKHAARTLRESEEQFRHLAESARAAILVMADDDTVLFANPAVQTIFGYPPSEVVGRPLTMLMPDEYRPRHRAGIERFLASGERRIRWEGVELPGLRKDGSVIALEVTISDFEREGKRYFTGLAHDISARKAYTAERERLLAATEAAVRSREEVLAIVSHDLRNPLNTILMGAKVLLELGLEEQHVRHLQVVKRSADRMNRLIQDLLDVVRLEAGQSLPLEARPVEVAALLAEACEAFQGQAATKIVHLLCGRAEQGLVVSADRDRVLQVLSNLIGNALKFTPEGGRVTVSSRREGAAVLFSVEDTGPGIPPDNLAHVFDLYWQAKQTARLGAGLGLTISKGIVEAHGGRIWVESQPGLGSTFWFSLPA